jgi:tetratricopeptide (TPR) repeat protein
MVVDINAFKIETSKKSLNELLDQLEVDLGHLGQGSAEQALKMLLKMDTAFQKVTDMTEKELPVKAEAAQLEYLALGMEHNAKAFLKQIGGREKLAQFRHSQAPAAQQRWWFLDEYKQIQARKTARTVFLGVASTIAAVLILIIVYQNFLAPDPIVTAVYMYQNNAEKAMQSQDMARALSETNKAIALTPNDSSLLIMRGVIEDRLSLSEQASKDYAAAEANLNDHLRFLLARSQIWMQAGEYQKGLEDARQVIQADPTSAEGFLYFGKANEKLQNYSTAIDAYETASSLAGSQNKSELNAVIRMNLAMLMQSIPMPTPEFFPSATK